MPTTTLPITPLADITEPESQKTLERAVHVLATEAEALSHVTRLYSTDPIARKGLLSAVECIVNVNEARGKVLVCGVGKSGYIAQKMVATMKSLGLASSFLHATEAMHGDLGDIRSTDAILFITFSGKTPELLSFLPHIPSEIPILAITAHSNPSSCQLLANRPDSILLPAPIHESEEKTFGVSAPTTSTTVAIAIGDMIALTAADRMHQAEAGAVFKRNHPGGAIGLAK
ncbi:SIS domain-containing protein [Tothia fuscella]|uniref:SIS domain-containing protein n=1 Tax=Tothia fuscella TaxID=1048955 RepID=A0A9P4U2N8_9PEZI|nr:SIS domain-containing protein [Tothia fuscella]